MYGTELYLFKMFVTLRSKICHLRPHITYLYCILLFPVILGDFQSQNVDLSL